MNQEGYIKFDCRLIEDIHPGQELTAELNDIRSRLYRLGFIGMYDNGIGYGNVSIREKGNRFIISATQTGGIEFLKAQDFTLVENYSIRDNYVICRGSARASSESLTHAVIYENAAKAMSVLHIHNTDLWKKVIFNVPTTPEGIEYGTIHMAEAVRNLILEYSLKTNGIIAMAGHEDGIVAFGRSPVEAYQEIIKLI